MPVLQSTPTPAPAVSAVTVVARRELRTKMQCTVSIEGRLNDCRVISEDPPGSGAGASALKLAHLFKMKPRSINGHVVGGGSVIIPIVFRQPAPADQTVAASVSAPDAAASPPQSSPP